MKKCFTYAMLTFMLVALWNCGGTSRGPDLNPEPTKKTLKGLPDWFLNNPEKEGYKYSAATETSRDMQMAIDKAALTAANALAGQMESEMSALIKRAKEETDLGEDSDVIDRFSSTQEQIISTTLQDYKIKKKDIQIESGNIYRVYVLIEWDAGAANKKLLAKIKADEALYTAMRTTELFDEMEEKVEAYRNRKSQ